MMESREEEYNIYNIARLMKEEEFGMHISLIDNGKEENGVPIFDIVVDSDLDAKTIQSILWGLLEKYEEIEGARDE
jgi:hypothetical protein